MTCKGRTFWLSHSMCQQWKEQAQECVIDPTAAAASRAGEEAVCVVGRRGGLVGAALDTQPRREERRQGDVASPLLPSPHLMNHLATKTAYAALVQWHRANILSRVCTTGIDIHADDIKDIIRKMAGGAERASISRVRGCITPATARVTTHSPRSTVHTHDSLS